MGQARKAYAGSPIGKPSHPKPIEHRYLRHSYIALLYGQPLVLVRVHAIVMGFTGSCWVQHSRVKTSSSEIDRGQALLFDERERAVPVIRAVARLRPAHEVQERLRGTHSSAIAGDNCLGYLVFH